MRRSFTAEAGSRPGNAAHCDANEQTSLVNQRSSVDGKRPDDPRLHNQEQIEFGAFEESAEGSKPSGSEPAGITN